MSLMWARMEKRIAARPLPDRGYLAGRVARVDAAHLRGSSPSRCRDIILFLG